MSKLILSRRGLLRVTATSLAGVGLAGCDAFDMLRDRDNGLRKALLSINNVTYYAQRLVQGNETLADEFSAADIRQAQKPNGNTDPDTEDYIALRDKNFADYQLQVDGLVEKPMAFSLDQLRNMPSRTQITRHDCVEGWSTIAKWQGVPLRQILDQVVVKPAARFALFHCYDSMGKTLTGEELYYESIDLVDARHPQTILAYAMNDKPLPVSNGAPLRVRVERQLGYKMAKYIRRIELVSGFAQIGGGNGGYWEDHGYEWYAGI